MTDKQNSLVIPRRRRIPQEVHAAMPLNLYELCVRTAAEWALAGDKKAARWYLDEIELREREEIRAEFGSLRRDGSLSHLYGMPCTVCGKPADTVDHILPVARGGKNNIENLQPMCKSCNFDKKDSLPEEQGINRE